MRPVTRPRVKARPEGHPAFVVAGRCRRRIPAALALALMSILTPSPLPAQTQKPEPPRAAAPVASARALLLEADKAIRLRDPERAVALWQKAAGLADPEAEYHLGNAFRTGVGVEKDAAKAAHWYQLAAAQRHADAQFALGTLYQYGRGVPADRERALALYRDAARAGHAEARRRLASFGKTGSTVLAAGSARVAASGVDANHALAQAARVGDVSAAREALARGASVAGPHDDSFPDPPLCDAIRRDALELVTLLLEHRADPNAPLDSGETPLVLAVRDASPAVVRALLRGGARPDAPMSNGSTALHEAARLGRIDVASDLLAGGASAKVVLADGTSAADTARRFGHDRLATLLRQRGAPMRSGPDMTARAEPGVRPQSGPAKSTTRPGELPAIVEAGRRGDVKLIRSRLAAGDAVDLRDAEGERALGRAAEGGHAEAVALLISSRADVNAPDDQGRTPLMRAAASPAPGAEAVMEALLAAGADPSARDRRGRGLLYHMAESATPRKVAPLLAKGIDWPSEDLSDALVRASVADRTQSLEVLLTLSNDPKVRSRALCASIEGQRKQAVGTLLTRGADASGSCEDGGRPLILAARAGDDELARQLIAAGADPSAPSRSGDTALIAAASRGHAAVVRRLLESGAPIDQRGERRLTALMAAAANGHLEVVNLLLTAGANPLHRDASDQRAVDLAEAAGHPDVAARLRKGGPGWRSWVGLSEEQP